MERQQAKERWENGWFTWRQKKVWPSYFPKFGVDINPVYASVYLFNSEFYDIKGKLLAAFYNSDHQLLKVCESSDIHVICTPPEQSSFKVTILYAGTTKEQKFPIGIMQSGTYQDERFTLSTAQFTRDIKPIQDKIAAIQKQERHPEEDEDWLSFLSHAILIAFLLLIFGRILYSKLQSQQS